MPATPASSRRCVSRGKRRRSLPASSELRPRECSRGAQREVRAVEMLDLFEDDAAVSASPEVIAPGAFILRQAAAERVPALLEALRRVIEQAPLRIMPTPAGLKMSVAMTNCGAAGWVSERSGYRYTAIDPLSGKPWPRMPAVFAGFASEVAARAGFIDFTPDACLINRYEPGVRLSLHQDRDERDFSAPIVSVSLGLPATFLFGGCRRSEQ